MVVHELNFGELGRIIRPVLQLRIMQACAKSIAGVLGSTNLNARNILDEAQQLLIRYKGYEVLLTDFRWITGGGPSVTITLRRNAQWWFRYFEDSERMILRIHKELVDDLLKIINEELDVPAFTMQRVAGYEPVLNEEIKWLALCPSGLVNEAWTAGHDVSPVQISFEAQPKRWFVSFSFNPCCFDRGEARSTVRPDWKQWGNAITEAIEASVQRLYSGDGSGYMSEDVWRLQMIADHGDEVVCELDDWWARLQAYRAKNA